jgi:Flp pilus assembly pilin Flp
MADKRTSRTFIQDESGAVTVEWALLIAAFGIPMILLVQQMLQLLGAHYRMMTFLLSMPLP